MTSIHHLAIYVHDLENMRLFYEKYFGAVAGPMYHNVKTDFRSYFLSFESGAKLELMTRPGTEEVEKVQFPIGLVHMAFSVGSAAVVDELTARIHADGYEIVSGPRVTGDGCYESCIKDPEGNLVEITETES